MTPRSCCCGRRTAAACTRCFQMLSEFEWRVLAGYQFGKTYREIARELQCKTKSVDNTLMPIKRKVSAASGEGIEWPFAE